MPSFDVVNQLMMIEVDNAINQANKEVSQRYDFKGTISSIERKEKEINIQSSDEYKVKACLDVLESKLVKRSISLKSLDKGKIEPAASGRSKQLIKLKDGIDQDNAKSLVKLIKDSKLKVQAAIQGEVVRVSSKSKDDLQATITLLKGKDFVLPLQFINFRD